MRSIRIHPAGPTRLAHLRARTRAHRPVRFTLAPALVGLVLLGILGGCSDEQKVTEPTTAPLALDDAVVPEVVFEGEAATISAWGRESGATFSRLEAEVLSWPGTDPGLIEVRAIGTAQPELGGADFQAQIALPPLRVGDYAVRLQGRDGTRTLSVLPAAGWVRYRSFDDPMRPNATLLVQADGLAIAHRDDRGRPARAQLSERDLAAITEWFADAHFLDLDRRYLSDHPIRVRRVDIGLHTDGGTHNVSAQEDLMPPELAVLVEHLDQLVEAVLASQETDRVPVVARLEIDPVEGEPASTRNLHLTLVNVSDQAVTLHFPTAQQYDFLVIRPPRSPHGTDLPGNTNDAPEVLLWSWSHDKTFPQVETDLAIQPGESVTFTEQWPGLDNRGNPVPPGVYHVSAQIPSDPGVRAAVARVVVRGQVPDVMPLVGTLSIEPATAPPGTERTIKLAVTNLNEFDITTTFPTSQRFDLALNNPRSLDGGGGHTDPGTRGLVWQWSADQDFEPVAEVVTWAAGSTRVFDAVWTGMDLEGRTAPTGIYDLKGWITGRPGAAIRPVTVVVGRP